MSIHLHIERLVLDGIDTGAAPQLVQAAIEAELARLLAAGTFGKAGATGESVARLALPDLALEPGEAADSLGTRIAAAVHGGIAR